MWRLVRTILFVHWNADEAFDLIKPLQRRWTVEVESEDGAAVWNKVKEGEPRTVVISLDRLPAQGRQTALSVRSQGLPLIFVGGEPPHVDALRREIPEAVFTNHDDLSKVLGGLG
jgi:hypothetical protein